MLIERTDHHQPVGAPELLLPKPLQIVPSGVVGSRVLRIVGGRFTCRAALVAHGLDNPVSVLPDHHRGEITGVDAGVLARQLGAVQVSQLAS
jgi:hypothetical protein